MILLIKQTYLKTPNFNFTEFVVCAVGWIISRVGRSGSVVVIYDVSAMRYAGYIDMIWYRVSCEARVFETEKSVFLGRCIWYVHRESKESTSEVVDFVPVVSVRSVLYRNVMYTKNSTQIHPPLSLWLVQCWYRTLPSISRQVWFTSVNSSIRSPCRIREWMQLPRWLVQRNVLNTWRQDTLDRSVLYMPFQNILSLNKVYRTGRYIHKDPCPESYCHCWSIPHRQIHCTRLA